jgi:LmbE family N-acetylglucosaminyl deacetylase
MRVLAVLAHPDDESLGFGGALAACAASGADVAIITGTRGERGRFGVYRPGEPGHPGAEALAEIRTGELHRAAATLGIRDVTLLDYPDGGLDGVAAPEAIARLSIEMRRLRPDVVLTFGPDGAYGHPDHIAISQLTTASVAMTGVAKTLYYLAWPQAAWDRYQGAIGQLRATVDGVARQAAPWPDWAVTTELDTRPVWRTVWNAVQCHASQISGYGQLAGLSDKDHEALWGHQSYYRVFSTVTVSRAREADLLESLRA